MARLKPELCDDPNAEALLRQLSEANHLATAREYLARSPLGIGDMTADPVAFVSGGIGDFFALESHLPERTRLGLRGLACATRAARSIRLMMATVRATFPRYEPGASRWCPWPMLWEEFAPDRFCWWSLPEVTEQLGRDDLIGTMEDWSILREFPRIAAGQLSFTGSSFLRYPLASVRWFGLPDRYIVVHPASANDRREQRDFDGADWAWLAGWLDRQGLPGVVLGTDSGPLPDGADLIDLRNQTTLPEAVEVLKRAEGFVGVASCLSVLAAQLFRDPRLVVKGPGTHVWQWRRVYFAPQTEFSWLVEALPEMAECHVDLEAGYAFQRDRSDVVPYDRAYWDKYVGYEGTDLGRALTDFRVDLCRRYVEWDQAILDVGIGSGAFLRGLDSRGMPARGFDVNPEAVAWLVARDLWHDPYTAEPWPGWIRAVSAWDVLEHLPEPDALLSRLPSGCLLFVSMPICPDLERLEEWQPHYRPNEHLWYFTADGFRRWIQARQFDILEESDDETRLGRKDIGTFVARKR